MPPGDKLFTFKINPELIEEYQRYCRAEGITASFDLREYIRHALRAKMDKLLAPEHTG